MTTSVIARCCSVVSAILIFFNSFGQMAEIPVETPMTAPTASIKVYKNILTEFYKDFPNADNVAWTRVEKNYRAKFDANGQKYVALFNPRADLVYQISYGKVNNLPANIRKDIKRMYIEFDITSAIQVEEAGRSIWVVNVEDETTFASVRVENGEIEEVQKYKKDNPDAPSKSTIAKH